MTYMLNGIENSETPNVLWHLHGHYNDQSSEEIQQKCLEVFEQLQEHLRSSGHHVLGVRRFEQKNGPHHPGSWDIYVKNAAIGDATVWVSLHRPAGVPIFFHPVLRNQGAAPTPEQEFVAHTECAIVFGMPADAAPESKDVNWNTQMDWDWVQQHWAS